MNAKYPTGAARLPTAAPAVAFDGGGGRLVRWLLWLLLASHAGLIHARGIELVLSEDSGAYVELADLLTTELPRTELRRLPAAKLEAETADAEGPDLVVALGTKALAASLSQRAAAPIVAALVPTEAYERLSRSAPRQRSGKPLSGVFLDQPPRRRFNLIRLALPEKSRVGVLLGSEHSADLRPLREIAAEMGLELVPEVVAGASDIYPSLSRLLAEVDLILAVPDASIYNGSNIHNILLATYRARVPLLGFSSAYVNAGALAAVYSTPRQIAPQVAEMVRRALAGRGLPPPQYPRAFSVNINQTVARSLGLSLDQGAVLESRLGALEQEP